LTASSSDIKKRRSVTKIVSEWGSSKLGGKDEAWNAGAGTGIGVDERLSLGGERGTGRSKSSQSLYGSSSLSISTTFDNNEQDEVEEFEYQSAQYLPTPKPVSRRASVLWSRLKTHAHALTGLTKDKDHHHQHRQQRLESPNHPSSNTPTSLSSPHPSTTPGSPNVSRPSSIVWSAADLAKAQVHAGFSSGISVGRRVSIDGDLSDIVGRLRSDSPEYEHDDEDDEEYDEEDGEGFMLDWEEGYQSQKTGEKEDRNGIEGDEISVEDLGEDAILSFLARHSLDPNYFNEGIETTDKSEYQVKLGQHKDVLMVEGLPTPRSRSSGEIEREIMTASSSDLVSVIDSSESV
jgi:hypothetical protein